MPGRSGQLWRSLFAYSLAVTACAALLVVSTTPASAAETVMEPYSARYAVYRNGKLQARAEFLLQQQGDTWVLKSESIGTHGMARVLKFRDYEFTEGHFDIPVRGCTIKLDDTVVVEDGKLVEGPGQ